MGEPAEGPPKGVQYHPRETGAVEGPKATRCTTLSSGQPWVPSAVDAVLERQIGSVDDNGAPSGAADKVVRTLKCVQRATPPGCGGLGYAPNLKMAVGCVRATEDERDALPRRLLLSARSGRRGPERVLLLPALKLLLRGFP